jgi:hypothetical protein
LLCHPVSRTDRSESGNDLLGVTESGSVQAPHAGNKCLVINGVADRKVRERDFGKLLGTPGAPGKHEYFCREFVGVTVAILPQVAQCDQGLHHVVRRAAR